MTLSDMGSIFLQVVLSVSHKCMACIRTVFYASHICEVQHNFFITDLILLPAFLLVSNVKRV